MIRDFSSILLGISLSVPTTLIDGTKTFTPPAPQGNNKPDTGHTAFLWQRPNSEAMVFHGMKWIELHHFVSQALYQQKTTSTTPAMLTKREASKKYPAWLEYALQLSRLRGYYTLYPSQETAKTIIGVHNDLPDAPEEFREDRDKSGSPKGFLDEGNEDFDADSPLSVLETLPEKGQMQIADDELPLLSWDGQIKSREELGDEASEYTTLYRRAVGNCDEEYTAKHPGAATDAADLFCRAKGTKA